MVGPQPIIHDHTKDRKFSMGFGVPTCKACKLRFKCTPAWDYDYMAHVDSTMLHLPPTLLYTYGENFGRLKTKEFPCKNKYGYMSPEFKHELKQIGITKVDFVNNVPGRSA